MKCTIKSSCISNGQFISGVLMHRESKKTVVLSMCKYQMTGRRMESESNSTKEIKRNLKKKYIGSLLFESTFHLSTVNNFSFNGTNCSHNAELFNECRKTDFQLLCVNQRVESVFFFATHF